MEAVRHVMRRGVDLSASKLLNFAPLTNPQKEHLSKVYIALLANVCMTAAGTYLQLFTPFSLPIWCILMAKVFFIFSLANSSPKYHHASEISTPMRTGMFLGIGLTSGMLVAEYLYVIQMYVGSKIIPTACISSIAVFACFSASALLAKQRQYLYLGAILSSALFYISLASLVQIFWRTKLVADFITWGALFMYLGFVLYDTQVTLVDFDAGNRDYFIHAVQFYTDLFGIFIQIVQIMEQNEQRNNNRRRKHNDD